MILSISGRIGSGKDTIADIIQTITPYYHWEVKKFAGKLKDVAELITGIPKVRFEDQEFKKSDMGPEWGMTYRDLLQKIGTEAMRNGVHENVWVNALFSEYQATTVTVGTSEFDFTEEDQLPNWIITDTRFPNELQAVKEKNGITIKVVRNTDNTVGVAHTSETALDDYTEWDYIVDNNGTIEDLKIQVMAILSTEGLLKYTGL